MRKKKILFIIIPIILLLIAGTTFGILYFTTDSLKSGQELFAKYFIQNGEILDMLENANLNEQETFKKSNSYNGTGELVLSVQSGSNTQEIKANTMSVYNANTKRHYNKVTLKNADSDLLEVSYINSGDVYAIKCNDITEHYIGFRNKDLKAFAKNMGMSDTDIQNIPDMIEFDSISRIGKITKEEKQHLIDTYSKVIFENIPKEKYSKMAKTQISIEGISYATNGYCLTVDPELSKQIVLKCLEILKGDNTTLVMISNKMSSVGIDSSYTDITKLAEAIHNMAEQYKKVDVKDTIQIEIYENNGKAIRTNLLLGEKNRITIDRPNKEEIKNAIITIETNSNTNTTEASAKKQVAQLIIQKIEAETETTNDITFIPNIENKEIQFSTNTTIGKVQGEVIKNISTVTTTMLSNGTNMETISATYTQSIQKANQVEEIAELKNSNTIIVNNYTKQQLAPFLTSIGNKAAQILPNKIAQLGIDFGIQQTETGGMSNITNLTTRIYKILRIVGTTGVSIANANGIDILNSFGIVGGVTLGTYINQAANQAITDANDIDISNNTNSEKNTNASIIEEHNSKFSTFKGEQKGNAVKSLCDIVKIHNTSNTNNVELQVALQMSSATKVITEPTTAITSESIEAIKAQIQPANRYIIDFGYSSTTGKIVAIGIVKK